VGIVNIFVADKLSDKNKTQLDSLGSQWVELRAANGFQRFENILKNLKIPYSKLPNHIDEEIEKILTELLE